MPKVIMSSQVVLQVRPNGAGPSTWPHRCQPLFLHHASELPGGAPSEPDKPAARVHSYTPEFDWVTVKASFLTRDEVVAAIEEARKEAGDSELEVEVDTATIDGWTAGLDFAHLIPWNRADEVINAWFNSHQDENWMYQFRLVTLPDPEANKAQPA